MAKIMKAISINLSPMPSLKILKSTASVLALCRERLSLSAMDKVRRSISKKITRAISLSLNSTKLSSSISHQRAMANISVALIMKITSIKYTATSLLSKKPNSVLKKLHNSRIGFIIFWHRLLFFC
jgi:hypothetical protein